MTQKKKLDRSEEDFFLLVALGWGRPDFNALRFNSAFVAFKHIGNYRHGVGIPAWLRLAPRGIAFANMVAQYGEARTRAGVLYKKYCVWTNRQDFQRDKSNRSNEDVQQTTL